MSGRFVDSVHREKEQGVPLQHLGEIVNVQGFDIDSWSRPEPVTNEVRTLPPRKSRTPLSALHPLQFALDWFSSWLCP